jgi:hypothetical protein
MRQEAVVLPDLLSFLQSVGLDVGRPSSDGNWFAYCPVHGERRGASTPSLHVHEQHGLWHCFACNAGGRLERLLEHLQCGREGGLQRLKEMREADPTFGTPPPRPAGRRQVQYLSPTFLQILHIDPPSLLAEGFDRDLLRAHSIGTDRVANRTVYPVYAPDGGLVGMVGKQENAQARRQWGKYKVYQEEMREIAHHLRITSFFQGDYQFHNHDWLWRADAVQRLPPEVPIIVCEGFKAALWWVQHGHPGAVALMGTKMSEPQAESLQRLKIPGRQFVLSLDNDPAGVLGTQALMREGAFIWRRVVYPEGVKQVDDIKDTHVLARMLAEARAW